ncbi:hypothetical protein AYO21_08220 [Fonsecaea monophora]|uniref:Uncharacterized protein n=1 Tax=Fonsecaea monophora TaxID=254056 RepID=A0A177F2S2_9EURO|nr:hypothetical protein AYO21_08220 [Fonsecaea monophora]OAG37612.1 hypothetical protein AYO21_08220 [Fonsecaea monophora]
MSDVPPEDSESALSTTADIFGILTFALGLFASCVAVMAAMYHANEDVEYYKGILRESREQIVQMKDLFEQMNIEADGAFLPVRDPINSSLKDLQQEFNSTVEKFMAFDFADPTINPIPHTSECHGTGQSVPRSLDPSSATLPSISAWKRLEWWWKEKDMLLRITKLQNQKNHFTVLLLIVLSL